MSDGPARQPTPGQALWRGATRRCPVCGSGGLFRRWFSMVPECPGCGFHFVREEGHWVGSLGMNTVISFGVLLVVLVVGIVLTAPDVAVVPLTVAAAATAILVPLLAFPFTRTLWSAVDLLMRPLEEGEVPGRGNGAP